MKTSMKNEIITQNENKREEGKEEAFEEGEGKGFMKHSRHGRAAAGTASVALRVLHSETQCRLQHKNFEEVAWPGARPV